MKKAIIYFFIGLSLLVWLVEMFTGWFDQILLRQFIRGAWGFWIYDFRCFPYGNEVVEIGRAHV